MKSEYDTCPRCEGRKLVRSRLCVHCKPSSTNHVTGDIRGLLCHGCNTSLGLLSESPDRIRGLFTYLESYGGDA
jgi:hypothetical protein